MAMANAGWLMAGRVLSDGLSLVLFGIIAREYGPAGVGIYSTFFAIATVLYDIIALGIDDYGVREYAAAARGNREALLRRLIRLQGAVATIAVAGVAVAMALRGITVVQAVTLVFLATFQVCNAFSRVLVIPRLVEGSLGPITLGSVVGRLGIALVALAASQLPEPSLLLALSGFPVFGLLTLAFAAWLYKRAVSEGAPATAPPPREPLQWGLLRQLAPFATANALFSIVVRIPMVVLFMDDGDFAAGLYATAFKLAELGWQVLLFVPLASYAALTRAARGDPRTLVAQADLLLRQTLLLGGIVAWGMYALGPPLLVPLLGAKVAPATPLLDVMAVFLLLQGPGTFLLRLMLVKELQNLRLKILATQAIVTLLLCLVLAPAHGPLGTVWALNAGELLTAILYWMALRRRMESGYINRRFAQFALAAVAAFAAGALLEGLDLHRVIAWSLALGVYVATCFATGLVGRDLLAKPAALPRA